MSQRPGSWTAEEQALLWAVGSGIRVASGREGRACDAAPACREIDPVALVRLAELHGVAGLAAEGLLAVVEDSAAPAAAAVDRLVASRDAQVRRSVRLASELLRLLELFERAGIRAVPMKGPLLAHRFYGSLARRGFWDLDLLLPHEAVLAAKDILLAQGYEPEHAWSPRQERRELRRNCEYNFDHRTSGIHVELHWRFLEPSIGFDLSVEDTWTRLESVDFLGRSIPVLALPDELLALIVHNGAKHGWERLRMTADVALLGARMSDEELRLLANRAETLGVRRVVATGALLASNLLAAPMGYLQEWAQADPRAEWLARHYAGELFRFDVERRRDGLAHARAYLVARERPVDRLRYAPRLARAVFLPTDREDALIPLPRALRGLHYAVRPVRLAWKYLRRAVRGPR